MPLTGSSCTEVSEGLIEILVHGVGSDCQRFREGCCQVLLSLGCDATYDLLDLVNHSNLMPGHRRRLEALMENLDDEPERPVDPIPGLFRAVLALIATSHLEDDSIRAVGFVADLIGRPLVAGVLMDELCDHYCDRRYAIRLINAIGSIQDALGPRHLDYLRQIVIFGPKEVEWRSQKLLDFIAESDGDGYRNVNDDSDAGCCGLKLLEWLERAAVVGPDTRVTDPAWIWLRNFRYQPRIINHGPILAYCRTPESSENADRHFAEEGF